MMGWIMQHILHSDRQLDELQKARSEVHKAADHLRNVAAETKIKSDELKGASRDVRQIAESALRILQKHHH